MWYFLLRRPVTFLFLTFATVILLGTLLLQLPWATFRGISFLDALFTATSATTVTGLVVLNTGADFTLFGQLIILLLIQLGALGIIIGAVSVFLFFKRGFSIKADVGLKTILEEEYVAEVKSTIKFIFLSVFSLQAIGALLLFFCWPQQGSGGGFSAVFHAVSAFSNAGFSLFENSLEDYRGDIFINALFALLIILGGLGFSVLRDIYQKIISFFQKSRARLTLHSKIVLLSTICLILLGAFLFYVFEKNNLTFLSEREMILASFFQSVTARTAGFNTVDIGGLTSPTSLLLIFLMFVGGSPGSTAGGIKVVSLALIFLSIISFLKRKEEIVIFGRAIPKIYFRNVFILASIYLLFCLVIFGLLLYTEKGAFEDILFEVFSAMGTVGLSTGLTPYLSDPGKILITVTMFVGRLLPLSLTLIGLRAFIKPAVRYLEEKVVLG